MKLWLIIFLFGNCFLNWTTAVSFNYKTYFVTIEKNVLKNITVTSDTLNVNLSGFRIEFIEEHALDGLTNIESLDLSRNAIGFIGSNTISKLENLKELSLAHNKFVGNFIWPEQLIGLNNLEVLNLERNNISEIMRNEFIGLPKSTNILFTGNPLQAMDSRAFIQLEGGARRSENSRSTRENRRSEEYYLKVCQSVDGIVEFVGLFGKNEVLGNCTTAIISRNSEIVNIKFNGGTVTGFKSGWYEKTFSYNSINLTSNFLCEITQEFINDIPSDLIVIDLSFNFISIIEDGVFEKFNLTALIINGNRLNSMNFVRTLPTSIEALDCGNNLISEIPSDLFHNLPNLQILLMDGNNLKKIESKTFEFQKNLELLDFRYNEISQIESDSFGDSEKNLKIRLDHNEIEEIPPHSFDKKGLDRLSLSFNKIKSISSDAFTRNLTSIYLNSNDIDTIESSSFSNMICKKIILSNNKITENVISNELFNGSVIELLALDDNPISTLNRGIFANFSVTRTLVLHNTPLKTIEKGAMIGLGGLETLYLSGTQLEELKNGALFGLSQEHHVSVRITGTPLRVIQAGVFDDL